MCAAGVGRQSARPTDAMTPAQQAAPFSRRSVSIDWTFLRDRVAQACERDVGPMMHLVLILFIANIALIPAAFVFAIIRRRKVLGFLATTWLFCGAIAGLMLSPELGLGPGLLLAIAGPAAVPILVVAVLLSLPLLGGPIFVLASGAAFAAARISRPLTSAGALRANFAFFSTALIASELLVFAVIRLSADLKAPDDYCLWRSSAYGMFENWLVADDSLTPPHATLVTGGVVYTWSFRQGRFVENSTPFVADGVVAACARRLRYRLPNSLSMSASLSST